MAHNFIKRAVPPLFIQAFKGLIAKPLGKGLYTGPYRSWEKALAHAKGYDSQVILKHVSDTIAQANQTQKGFERDGVMIENKDYAYPVLAYLARHAFAHGGKLKVIDFGGGLGSAYYQAKYFFGNSIEMDWQIVEQPNFVEAGRQLALSPELSFVDTVEGCARTDDDLMLVSGVLQYLGDPFHLLKQWSALGFKYFLIDRVPLTQKHHHQIMVQHVPKQLYQASYPSWLFSEKKWCHELSQLGDIEDNFASIDGHIQTVSLSIDFKGFWLCLK